MSIIMIDGKLLYPIGSIYMSIQDTNPSVFFGGTWERIAKGKTLVGVDENDEDFNASSKTGGEKEHTLTASEMAKLSYSIMTGSPNGSALNGNYLSYASTTDLSKRNYTSDNFTTNAGGQAHNNMQPYYTCYIFVRTA